MLTKDRKVFLLIVNRKQVILSFESFADKIFAVCILKPGDSYELLMISNIIDSSQDKAVLLFVSDFDRTVKILVASVDYGLKIFYKNDL